MFGWTTACQNLGSNEQLFVDKRRLGEYDPGITAKFTRFWVYKLDSESRDCGELLKTLQVFMLKTIARFGSIALLSLVAAGPAFAQSAFNSSAATGDSGNGSQTTGVQAQQQYEAFDRSKPIGSGFGGDLTEPDTMSTRTKNYLFGSGGLQSTTTGLQATQSVNPAPIPSGGFTNGFHGQSESKLYQGIYGRPGGPYGGELPATSLGSVDFDISTGSGSGAPVSAKKMLDQARNGGYWNPDFEGASNSIQQIGDGIQKVPQGIGQGASQINSGVNNLQNASQGF